MKKYFKNNKGFTLIELMVTISIISLLSSIVLVTLNSTRNKAKDAVVRAEVKEFEKLLIMEYNDVGNYSKLQSAGWAPATPCSSMFSTSAYVVQARKLCDIIVLNASTIWGPNNSFIVLNSVDTINKYSILVPLNNGFQFCVGSSGTSDNVRYNYSLLDGSDVSGLPDRWSETPKGCYFNP